MPPFNLTVSETRPSVAPTSGRQHSADETKGHETHPIAKPTAVARPNLLSPAGVLALQRLAGNSAVAAALGDDHRNAGGEADLPLKTLTVNCSYLQQNKSVDDDLSKTNEVYQHAAVRVDRGSEERPSERDAKKILGEDLILEEGSPTSPSREENKLLKTNRATGTITAYLVNKLSGGASGESFWPSTGQPASVVVAADTAESRTLPHELGHVLLNDGRHPDDNNNFMAQSWSATHKELMTPEQIKTIRESPFLK